MTKIGFIGCGNMASAMLKGILAKGACAPEDVTVSAHSAATLNRVSAEFGVQVVQDNADVVRASDIVFLAVKPQVYDAVLAEIRAVFGGESGVASWLGDKVLVSLAPGKSLAWLAETSPFSKIVRIMPNTPAAVGEGMPSITCNEACSAADKREVEALIGAFGRYAEVPEKLINAVITASGSSPAFVYMFIEAMADAAVLEGMPRAQAYEFAAQAVLGSAKMVLESGMHPGQLKDAVCSPGGTTIEGVRVLEQCGMRSAVMEALGATARKARSM